MTILDAHPDMQARPSTAFEPGHASRAGVGHLELRQVADRTEVTRCRAESPLKLLTPRGIGRDGRVYVSSYGGGLVAGDHIRLTLTVHRRATGLLCTQASTKVYRQQDDRGATQELHASLGDQATLIVTPDPLVCYAQARYRQQQRFELTATSNLVLLDWFTCGRLARGERWAFERLASRNIVTTDGELLLDDSLVLDRSAGPLDSPCRTGRFNCFANLFIFGPRFSEDCDALVAATADLPVHRRPRCVVSASRRPWGAVVRLGGVTTEGVGGELARRLGFLRRVLDVMPWERKW